MRITTAEGTIPAGQEQTAAEKLFRLENLIDALSREQADAAEKLSALRAQDKMKSARFRELLGQKLILGQIITRLQLAGLMDG